MQGMAGQQVGAAGLAGPAGSRWRLARVWADGLLLLLAPLLLRLRCDLLLGHQKLQGSRAAGRQGTRARPMLIARHSAATA